MKRIIFITTIIFMAVAGPVLAQEDDAFFDILRSNLSGTGEEAVFQETPEIRIEHPALGSSVAYQEQEAAVSPSPTSGPYVAGRDTLSGPVAAAAVLLATVVLVLIFLLATSRSHGGKDD